jgi:hypothetical protein
MTLRRTSCVSVALSGLAICMRKASLHRNRQLTLFVLASCVFMGMAAEQVRGAESPGKSRLLELAGGDAKDCGSIPTNDVSPGALSEPCLVKAFREHRAAFWETERLPKSTSLVTGMAVTSGGALYVVESDGSRSTEHRCVEPAVVTEFGRERLRCKENYIAPFKATETPYRPGGGVSSPRPMADLKIPAGICDPSSTRVQVDFVIDVTGKVLLADVMAAPKQCHMRELEAALYQFTFEPGTFRGAPVITTWFTIINLSSDH